MSWSDVLRSNAYLIGIVLASILSVLAFFVIRWFLLERQNSEQEINTQELSDASDASPSSKGENTEGEPHLRHERGRSDTEVRIGDDHTGLDAVPNVDEGSVIASGTSRRWFIRGLEPSAAKMTLRFTADQLADGFVIGRDDDESDLVVDVDEVSRRHAVLRSVGGKLQIKDLGSSNGTWLDEEKIAPDTWRSLQVPVYIRFGPAKFRIEASA